MYWLGLDPLSAKEKEIGARPHFFKKDPHTPERFGHQMERVFWLLARVMVRGGHAVFQVGTSVIRGEVIDNAALIRNAAISHGFVLAAELSREIPLTRKAFNLNHSRIHSEELMVFRLESE
jgi:site-specific DNA-methyltransferase (cytosine-N4-specific)